MTEEEKSGDDNLAQGKYDSAILYYEDALKIVRNSQGFLGEKESSSLARKLADAKARRWNPEMESVYAGIDKKLDKLWKEDKFEEYLNMVNRIFNELKMIKNKGGSNEEVERKILEKYQFYDKNINNARADYLARKYNPEMVLLYEKSVVELNQLWKEEKFEDYLNFVNKSINKMYELMNQGGNREDLYVKIWKRKYLS